MFLSRSPAVAAWLLAAGLACGMSSAAWADSAETSKLHPWVLLAVFWSAAFLSVMAHYVIRYVARAAAWVRGSWDGGAAQRARLRRRAWALSAHAAAVAQRWARRSVDGLTEAAAASMRALEQPMAGARRVHAAFSGALIGWSRSALRSLRA